MCAPNAKIPVRANYRNLNVPRGFEFKFESGGNSNLVRVAVRVVVLEAAAELEVAAVVGELRGRPRAIGHVCKFSNF